MHALRAGFLVWLMILATPLQGLAAIVGLSCASHHASTASTSAHTQVASDFSHQGHQQHADPKALADYAGPGQCSVCAACFAGTAPISQAQQAQLGSPINLPIPFFPSLFSDYTPDRPDPPPKTV